MGLVRAALRNPYAVIVMALGVLLIGITALGRVPADILPVFKTPAVQILTFYPGVPAEVVEQDITTRLERWTGQSNGVARQESKSLIGVSIVKDFFRPDIDPNTAMSQVTSLAMSDLYYLPPGTIPPMVMPFDPTASIPLALITVSSPRFDETKLYDVAYFDLRNRLQGISGVIAPAVYGGKLRRILAYVDRDKLQARNLSPMDVVQALRSFNLMIPTGNAKFGALDYQIDANSMAPRVEMMNDFPIKIDNGAPVFLKDVGRAEDSHQIQTNMVRISAPPDFEGKRQVYIPIYRQPGANTIQVVDGIRETIGKILTRLPEGIHLDVVMDQSVYVREAIRNLIGEGILGALMAALMILLFLGSVRSTAIVLVALPLAVLAAFIGLFFTGDSINAMTLGGLAMAVGLLIDQSIVVLENISRHLEEGKSSFQAALDGAGEVAMPVLIISITIVVVFFPVVFLTGIGKFLFTPLALSVTFAIAASYILSMTLVPTAAARFLQSAEKGGQTTKTGFFSALEHGFARLRDRYGRILRWSLVHTGVVLGIAGLVFVGSLLLVPAIGTELFPEVDAGQLMVRVRAPSGTRVEITEGIIQRVEDVVRREIPREDLQMMISNIGVLYDWPAAYTPNSGPMDAFINVQLTEQRRHTAQDYAHRLRPKLRDEFPGIEFAFDTGGLITAALNFGLPSPINIQVEGNKLDVAYSIARRIKEAVEQVSGTVDVRIQQKPDYPQIQIEVDRVKAAYLGLTQEQVVKNIVTTLNSSINFAPAFWIDHRNGNHYFLGAQYREEDIRSFETLENIPITGSNGRQPVLLKNVATFRRATAPAEINHLNITRVTDVYANVRGRDIGSVATDIEKKLVDIRQDIPQGYFISMRGEVQSMRESFQNLGFGLGMAVALVYLNTQLVDKLKSAWQTRNSTYKPRTRHLNPDGSPQYTNRLFLESSPYLLQHAHNPVNWYPWGDEAFETARKLRRPVLLSVGYSTCHWCHVMEEESFENEEIAFYLNENYIAIKVDREERPDIDAIYMKAVQTVTGGGGWPMTVWLTPDRQPFYGGTYFPARDGDQGSRIGFLTLLTKLKTVYDKEPDRVVQSATELAQIIKADLAPSSAASNLPDTQVLDAATSIYRQHFDQTYGGIQGAPKFPSGLPIRFLLRHYRRLQDKPSLAMATLTLEKMAVGGMYDQVGGGFHRYSTDAQWLVPHFEKMLYDNALLIMAYLEGYQVTKREDFAQIAREVLRYVERDMTSPEGAFYSATDADSMNPSGHREEGWFFTWTPAEIEAVLGKERARVVTAYYGVTEGGNFEGRNIFHVLPSIDAVAKELQVSPDKVHTMIQESKDLLYAARAKRPPPLRDEKILTAWNGLMISALAQAALVLGDARYADQAARAADFVLTKMRKDGRLLRSHKDSQAQYNGYLDDYAFLIAGLLDLYEATSNPRWLKEALVLDKVLEDHYEDKQGGGFFMTSTDHEALLAREKPSYDGAEPSGNSIHALNLFRLYEFTTKGRYRVRAEKTLQAFGEILKQAPAALSEMLLAVDYHLDTPKEIVIVTPKSRTEAEPFLTQLRTTFLPNRILVVTTEGEDLAVQATLVPLVASKIAQGGKATAYVCEQKVCALPTTDPTIFAKQISIVYQPQASRENGNATP